MAELEREFQTTVLQLAETLHWRAYHTHDSRRSQPGFPDLVLVRERVIFVELKRDGQKPSANQVVWLNDLARAGAEVYLWTPADWQEIASILSRRVPQPESGT